MGEPLALARIYVRLVAARVRGQLEYRASFALSLGGTLLLSFLDFAAILVIFGNVEALAGWSVAEVAFLYGIASVSFALTDLAIGHLDLLPEMIRQGTFDAVLVRPLPALLQVVASDFALRRLGKAFQGVAVLAVALVHLDTNWTAARVAWVGVTVVSGIAIYAAIWIVVATIAFWAVDSGEFANAFTYGGNFLAQYPVDVFAPWLRRFVIFVVPIAFVAWFPALYVLGKDDGLGLPGALRFGAPLVAVAAAVAARVAWGAAVGRYRSAGG